MKATLLKLTAIAFMALVLTTSVRAEKLLCLFGDATRSGWDKGNASPMIQDATDPAVFHYDAWLNTGNFKFILENTDDSWLPTWNKDTETTIFKRTSENATDINDTQFSIETAGNYSISVDTLNLTVSITPMAETEKIEFNTVFIVGDATPNGWDIANSTELTKSSTTPFEFSYTGALTTGDFKFPVNRNSGWGQDFFMKVSDTEMVLQNSPDSKWTITEEGNYNITMNTKDLSIDIQKQTTTQAENNSAEKVSISVESTNRIIHVSCAKNVGGDINVYSVTGQRTAYATLNTNTDIRIREAGIYLVSVCHNGKTTIQKVLVK
ncbi:MAG: SusF/SusE family outer membrane protein [Paludibacter sp.]|nr:SusF/SusE family outer membrane protein [Paludibacter sp.]